MTMKEHGNSTRLAVGCASAAPSTTAYLPPDWEFAECRYETMEVARYMGVKTLLPGAGGIVEFAAADLIERSAETDSALRVAGTLRPLAEMNP